MYYCVISSKRKQKPTFDKPGEIFPAKVEQCTLRVSAFGNDLLWTALSQIIRSAVKHDKTKRCQAKSIHFCGFYISLILF